jgi:L-fucose isomerase-like protein
VFRRDVDAFSYLTVASALHDARSLEAARADLDGPLVALGGHATDDPGVAGAVVISVLTGGTEQMILDALAPRDAREAALLVTHPRHNSLPTGLEALARLRQDGRTGRIVHLDGRDAAHARLREAVDDLRVADALRRIRIGLVGEPSDWLVASSPAPDAVSASWGPTVVPVHVAELIDASARPPAGTGARLAAAVAGGARGRVEPDDTDIARAASVHPALQTLVARYELDAVTVRCFDLLGALGTSGCVALAALNDAGVVAGCEGDMPSTIAMLWVRMLLGATPWMANPAQADEDGDTLLLAHCTVPRGLVRNYRLRSHFESGLGVAFEGELPEGPVTLVRIGGRELDALWIAEGEAVATQAREDLCRTQLAVQLDRGVVGDLLRTPLGNHVVVAYGHHHARLQTWWESARSPAIG